MNSITVPTRRRAPRMLVACVTVLLVVIRVDAANAATPRSAVTPADSRQVSFAGTTFAAGASENVDVVGNLHVMTQLSGSEQTGWTVEWHANLDNTTGTGQTTGDRHQGIGADRGTVAYPPGPPTRSVFFEPSFTLRPSGGSIHPPSPCRLAVNVVFDETGQVSAVEVHVVDQPTTGSVD